jgi:hypothetical protein
MPSDGPLSISMLLQNYGQALISKPLALKWGRLIVAEKYPAGMFVAGGKEDVVDEGSAWLVSFHNELKTSESLSLPVIRVRIRKLDGAILELPAH